MMKYISTRGKAPALGFEDVLLAGLASDGGLYVPETYPHFSPEDITAMAGLPYAQLAHRILMPFVEGAIPSETLLTLCEETYAAFAHKAVAPLKQIDNQQWVLELFHGPTLAFKDFALQLLGRLLDYVLQKRQQRVTIIGATSGDTGSAAIEGCRACENVDIIILHPHGRVSPIQRRQMTTAIADNIHNLAIEGNFDDCQTMVKEMFSNQDFLEGKSTLIAVNSINWARIMAQIVYYFYAALQLGSPAKSVAFSVPTGNFGDIFAGYVASKMGLPIHQLIIATNSNDILHRFLEQNHYDRMQLQHTHSPSMDIQISSNFERLLFDAHQQDGAKICAMMAYFKENGSLSIEESTLGTVRELFSSYSVSDAETLDTIAATFRDTGELLDPHTAIGVAAARKCVTRPDLPLVVLATAHPVKFAAAIELAGLAVPPLPQHLADLLERKEAFTVLPHDLDKVKDFILQQLG
jgi:threonine synthase